MGTLDWPTKTDNEGKMSSEDFTSLKELLLKLHKLKKKNRDSISDYYEWVSSGLFYKIFQINEDDVVQTLLRREVVDAELKLYPFEAAVWKNWVDNRRRIEHRDQTEASIQCVLQGLAITAKLLEVYANNGQTGIWFESKLFDTYSSVVWLHNTRRFT